MTKSQTHDLQGRLYARLSQLKPGDIVVVDGDFKGCFLPFSELPVVQLADGKLALYHNVPNCGACGGGLDEDCPHSLDGQLADDDDTLIGIYRKEDFNTCVV
jgi:hypothetical protein